MAKREQVPLKFEDKLEALEKLTEQMEDGSLGLDESLKLYEQGMRLAESLKKELEEAENSLLELKDGKLKPLDDAQ